MHERNIAFILLVGWFVGWSVNSRFFGHINLAFAVGKDFAVEVLSSRGLVCSPLSEKLSIFVAFQPRSRVYSIVLTARSCV